MKVLKRNGSIVDFDSEKIKKAVLKAMRFGNGDIDESLATLISTGFDVQDEGLISIDDIEDYVYMSLCEYGEYLTAKSYEQYRALREYQREKNTIDNTILGILNGTDKEVLDENSNKQQFLNSTVRDLIAEEVSKDISLRMKLPAHITQAHNEGIIHIHDLGHYSNHSFNCCLINLQDMLDNGTVINGKMIETPKSFQTACTITTQIIAQVASGQFGGQTITLSHLAPYVRISKTKIYNKIKKDWESHNLNYTEDMLEESTMRELKTEVKAGIQTLQYQINTLQTSNGQAPFLSVFMYIGEDLEYQKETAMLSEELLKQRLQGLKNEVGAYTTPAFPKLLYVLDENNTYDGSEFFYITKLASECIPRRMMPDIISAKIMKEEYDGQVIPPMGCRAFLSSYKGDINNPRGGYKLYGRGNMGVTSINLCDVGLSANENLDVFWTIFDDRLELCKESLILRYEKLKNVTSDVSPIHWQHGAIARLEKHEPITNLLQNGYFTISLGYIGLYECVKALIGESHTQENGEKLALEIMSYMREKVDSWKKETGLGFALYGTPSESLTYRFAKSCKERFGTVEGITDKDYLTNSYHVNVQEEINAFDKLKFESQFHSISAGGAISYIEIPNMIKNPEGVLSLMQFMYENIRYAEMNTKSDFCHECKFDGEILCDEDLEWYCPSCGNRDKDRMNVVRRTCGYLGENFWNEGRTEEIKDRVMHI